MRSLFFVPDSGDVDVAPALPLPGGPVDPVRGDGDDGGAPRNSLWRKGGLTQGAGNIAALSRVTSKGTARPPPGSRSVRRGMERRPATTARSGVHTADMSAAQASEAEQKPWN